MFVREVRLFCSVLTWKLRIMSRTLRCKNHSHFRRGTIERGISYKARRIDLFVVCFFMFHSMKSPSFLLPVSDVPMQKCSFKLSDLGIDRRE